MREENDNDQEQDDQEQVEDSIQQAKHVIFENDNYDQALTNAIWFSRKMPSKRQFNMENKQVATRGRPQ